MADAAIAGAAPRIGGRLWILPPLLVLAGLFSCPPSLIAPQALPGDGTQVSLDHFAAVFRSALFVGALWHTIEIAVAASAGCLVLGFAIALVLAFVPFPGAREIARFIDTFIALPTFLAALAFTFIYGSAGVLNGALIQLFG